LFAMVSDGHQGSMSWPLTLSYQDSDGDKYTRQYSIDLSIEKMTVTLRFRR
jgi:hypothetical protein